MKKYLCLCLYIGASYLLFGVVETKAQIASTALSITLRPFLSLSVNPVYNREIDPSKTEMLAQGSYSYHQSFEHVAVVSNEAFEIRVDHINLPNNHSISLDVQLIRNWDNIGVDTLFCKKVGLKVLEAKSAVKLVNEKSNDIATIAIFKYTLTAL